MKMLGVMVVAAVLCACVPYPGALPEDYGGRTAIVTGVFPALDAGAAEQPSLHFHVRAYGGLKAQQIADMAENAYNRIMVDTGLSSFKPMGGQYQLVVYGNAEEYRGKTGQPSWSGGVAVGNAIYSFDGPQLEKVVSHEMTHLIFYEYMGRVNLEHRWVNEGLAVYEESKAGQSSSGGSQPPPPLRASNWQPIPMDQMLRLVPATEREYTVNNWYAQAESMVRFMVERGGRIGFSQFLAALRNDVKWDAAFSTGFPGIWSSFSDFEQAWKRSQ